MYEFLAGENEPKCCMCGNRQVNRLSEGTEGGGQCLGTVLHHSGRMRSATPWLMLARHHSPMSGSLCNA